MIIMSVIDLNIWSLSGTLTTIWHSHDFIIGLFWLMIIVQEKKLKTTFKKNTKSTSTVSYKTSRNFELP